MKLALGISRIAIWLIERVLEMFVTASAGLIILGPNNMVASKDGLIPQIFQNAVYVFFFELTSPYLALAVVVLAFVDKAPGRYCLYMGLIAVISALVFGSLSALDAVAMLPLVAIFILSVLVFSFLGQMGFEKVAKRLTLAG